MDKLALKRKEEDEKPNCDECVEKEPVVAYCVDCNSNLCLFCYESHKRSKRFRGHVPTLIINQQLNKDINIQPKAITLMCKDHNLELLLYCGSCNQLICKHCVVKNHNGHNYASASIKICKCQIELEKVTTSAEVVKSLPVTYDYTTDKIKKVKYFDSLIIIVVDSYVTWLGKSNILL